MKSFAILEYITFVSFLLIYFALWGCRLGKPKDPEVKKWYVNGIMFGLALAWFTTIGGALALSEVQVSTTPTVMSGVAAILFSGFMTTAFFSLLLEKKLVAFSFVAALTSAGIGMWAFLLI